MIPGVSVLRTPQNHITVLCRFDVSDDEYNDDREFVESGLDKQEPWMDPLGDLADGEELREIHGTDPYERKTLPQVCKD